MMGIYLPEGQFFLLLPELQSELPVVAVRGHNKVAGGHDHPPVTWKMKKEKEVASMSHFFFPKKTCLGTRHNLIISA